MFQFLKKLFTPYPRPPVAPRNPEKFTCTYCGGDLFNEGPQGGLSTNIMCANERCQHWFDWHLGIFPTDDLNEVGPERLPPSLPPPPQLETPFPTGPTWRHQPRRSETP